MQYCAYNPSTSDTCLLLTIRLLPKFSALKQISVLLWRYVAPWLRKPIFLIASRGPAFDLEPYPRRPSFT
jgi:hypothetical protein